MPQSPTELPVFISKQIKKHRLFFANLKASPKMEGLVVACGGWEKCAPDYVVERKGFGFHAVEFIARGRGTLQMFGNDYELRAGMLFCYGPGVAHRIRSFADNPLEKYFVDFSGCDAAPLVRELQRARVVQVTNAEMPRLYFEQLLEVGSQSFGLAGRAAKKQTKVMALLVELLVRQAVMSPHSPGSNKVAISYAGYERCTALLRQNFLTLTSAEELAQLAHIDSAYMTRLFQKHGTESPYQMLVRLKMNQAAEQLATSPFAIKVIGAEVGFPDPYHFSRVFKRVHGLPPGRFREYYHRSTSGAVDK